MLLAPSFARGGVLLIAPRGRSPAPRSPIAAWFRRRWGRRLGRALPDRVRGRRVCCWLMNVLWRRGVYGMNWGWSNIVAFIDVLVLFLEMLLERRSVGNHFVSESLDRSFGHSRCRGREVEVVVDRAGGGTKGGRSSCVPVFLWLLAVVPCG